MITDTYRNPETKRLAALAEQLRAEIDLAEANLSGHRPTAEQREWLDEARADYQRLVARLEALS